MKTLRVGIIGANAERGWARESHVPAVQHLDGLELAAVANKGQEAADAAAAMFTGDQTALAVARIAIAVPGRLAEDADGAGFFLPFQEAIIGDVAPEQVAAVAEVHWTFGPAAAIRESFDRGERKAQGVEAGV